MRKNKNNIKPDEAAEILGVSPQFVRVAIQQKELPIGTAIKMPGSTHWTYLITPKLLADYCGKDIEAEIAKIRARA